MALVALSVLELRLSVVSASMVVSLIGCRWSPRLRRVAIIAATGSGLLTLVATGLAVGWSDWPDVVGMACSVPLSLDRDNDQHASDDRHRNPLLGTDRRTKRRAFRCIRRGNRDGAPVGVDLEQVAFFWGRAQAHSLRLVRRWGCWCSVAPSRIPRCGFRSFASAPRSSLSRRSRRPKKKVKLPVDRTMRQARTSTQQASRSGGTTKPRRDKEQLQAIRDRANNNGCQVSSRGRIPVEDAYEKAH